MPRSQISNRVASMAGGLQSGFPAAFTLSFVLAMGFIVSPTPGNAQAPREDCTPQDNDGVGKQDRSLTEKLDKCNGELKAPGVGDDEMVEPAPETGNMPIIKPNEVPPSRNPSRDSGQGG